MTSSPEMALQLVQRYANDMSVGREQRDDAMRRARMLGATFRQIADAAAMSPQGVRKCLANRILEQLDNSVHNDIESAS
jgi:hypothetical protein